jgi:hypothetical protein
VAILIRINFTHLGGLEINENMVKAGGMRGFLIAAMQAVREQRRKTRKYL